MHKIEGDWKAGVGFLRNTRRLVNFLVNRTYRAYQSFEHEHHFPMAVHANTPSCDFGN
jgi:hypothetical protein